MINENIAKTLTVNSAILGSGLTSNQKQVDNFMATRNFNSAIAESIRFGEKLTSVFGLTAEQSEYVQVLLAKPYDREKDKFSPKDRAMLYAASLAQGGILDGTYTIISPSGDHRTVKLTTCLDQESPFFGTRSLSLLTGSNNEVDYKRFARFSAKTGATCFKKSLELNAKANQEAKETGKKEFSLEKLAKIVANLLIKGDQGDAAKLGFTIEASKHCLVCGRKLTHPSSLDVNMGAKCYNDIHDK